MNSLPLISHRLYVAALRPVKDAPSKNSGKSRNLEADSGSPAKNMDAGPANGSKPVAPASWPYPSQ